MDATKAVESARSLPNNTRPQGSGVNYAKLFPKIVPGIIIKIHRGVKLLGISFKLPPTQLFVGEREAKK